MAKRKTDEADRERGKRIKQAYEAVGLKRARFAELLGRYYHDVMRLESGQKPDPDTLSRIAEICSVTERWLVRGPRYSPEFELWLDREAPRDLEPVERELLASINFPQPHPGAGWYSAALATWRLGSRADDRTQVRQRPKLRPVE